MGKIMMSIRWEGKVPTIDEVQQHFSLTDKEIDRAFGVVEVDPEDKVYTILVEESAVSKVQSGDIATVEGPFSNPRIEPFGPPEASTKSDSNNE